MLTGELRSQIDAVWMTCTRWKKTSRHIIKLMVELNAPTAKDVICDPASGTCGFLVAA